MRLSPVERVLLAACIVMALVVTYWGIKILAA
jgi:cell division protein FtsL